MSGSLRGRRAFITGSLQGIGLGIATTFAREGADIVLHGLGDDALMATAEMVIKNTGAGKVESYCTDLRDSAATEELVANIFASGPVDILVNNAGIGMTSWQ
jgi:3-hydroxybutyrate dehydrogenase